MNLTNDIEEVKGILKSIKNDKVKSCPDENNILEWTASDLRSYVMIKTKGMSIAKKLKFAKELDKKIKDAKYSRASS